MIRQSLLSLVFTSSTYSFESKMITAMALIFLSLILQLNFKPYNSTNLNNMEILSLIASNFTLFSGFLMHYDLTDSLIISLTWLIVIANTFFIYTFSKQIFLIFLSKHVKILVRFCPCISLIKLYVVMKRCRINIIFIKYCKPFFS